MSGIASLPVVLVAVLLMVTSGAGYPHTGSVVANCFKTQNMVQAETEYSADHSPNFRVCYTADYNNAQCSLQGGLYQEIQSQGFGIFQFYNIQTPIKDSSGNYPDNQHCSYSLEDRQPGFQYTYLYLSTPDIEAQITGHSKSCYDCMEHEHTDEYSSTSKLVTCGNDVDSRLNYGSGTISNIAFTFKSDGTNGLQGADFYVFEGLITGSRGHGRCFGKCGATNNAKDQVMAVSGLPGLKGHPGLSGGAGPTGPDGDKGLPGQKGAIGDRGNGGSQGNKGIRGSQGPQGLPGRKGAKGFKGEPGPPGLPGTPCMCLKGTIPHCVSVPGEPGSPGDIGEMGKLGLKGFPGLPGTKGNKGVPGLPGERGRTGNPGRPGKRGPQGDPGPRGASGPPGSSSCPGITANDIKNIRTILKSDVLVHKSYFNAWRGHLRLQKASEIILRHYLPDEQLDRTNSFNLSAKRTNVNQFRIRRGTSLTAWADSKDKILTKLKEYERFLKSSPKGQQGTSTASFFCPKGQQGLPGPYSPSGDKGDIGPAGNPGAKGQAGEPGEYGSKGSSGDRGPQGEQGSHGPPGRPGKQGPQGRKGLQCAGQGSRNPAILIPSLLIGSPGQKGSKGNRGDTGIRGIRGPPGDPGRKGYGGINGKKGDKGTDGQTGLTGLTGPKGQPGDAGPVGPPGPPGCACKLFKLFMDIYHIILPTGGIVHETVINTAASAAPGSAPHNFCVTGPPGIPGNKSPEGPRGRHGNDGAPGIAGDKGKQGPKGEKGMKGLKGDAGPEGPAGRSGLVGEDGSSGRVGILGLPGQNCEHTSRNSVITSPLRCPPGKKGTKGVKGPRGYPGAAGPKGIQGYQGIPGSDGQKGRRGLFGYQGRRGYTGPSGVPGPTGSAGLPGSPGNRDNCPEFDGIDLGLVQPNPAEYAAIRRLMSGKEKAYACSLRDASQPLLRQLAFHICDGSSGE